MRPLSLTFLRDICNAPSPSGYEEPAAEVYRNYTGGFADTVSTDVHGSVTAVLNPDAEMKIMLAGHMDEIGFIINFISDDGLIYFRGVGGHDSMIPLGQRVWIHGKERVAGCIGRKPIHLLDTSERDKRPELYDLWIDIGASSKAEAIEVVSVGDPVTFQYEFQELLGDRAAARGFDNKCGSWVVAEALRLLKEDGGLDPGVGVYAVATVQEEIGLRGAKTSAFGINAQSGIAVDVTFAIDHPGVSKTRYGECDLGKGPTVTRGANANPKVFRMIVDAAEKLEMNIQIEAEPGGTGTDGNAMQLNQAGMAVGILGVPLRYMHTPCEVLSLKDLEQTAQLMAGYCREVKPDSDFTPRLG
jgi:endoglucanase